MSYRQSQKRPLDRLEAPTSPAAVSDRESTTTHGRQPENGTQTAPKRSRARNPPPQPIQSRRQAQEATEGTQEETATTPKERPTTSPAESHRTHGSTTGDRQTTHAHREPQNGTQDATTGTRAATTAPPHDRQTAGATTTRGSPKCLFTDPKHF